MASNSLNAINNQLANASGQQAAQSQSQSQAGLGNYGGLGASQNPTYTAVGSLVMTGYPVQYVGNGYVTYQFPPGTSGWPQAQEPPTKAEQWIFQKAILRAELKDFCKHLIWKSIVLAVWTNSAYSFFTLIFGVKISAGTTWMIFGLIPLMALAAKQRILQWGERFLG